MIYKEEEEMGLQASSKRHEAKGVRRRRPRSASIRKVFSMAVMAMIVRNPR